MANCLVAQSGGPTAVINASLAGVIRANQLNPLYDRVLGGLHGIEGTLAGNLFDLTDLSGREIEVLKQTPSCALGTCRYKFSDEADFQAKPCYDQQALMRRYEVIAEICDYMCGSGTTQDAAHTMGIISHCYDLHSGFDLINCEIPERPEFVFWHPPYWDLITYSDVMYKASEVQSKYGYDPRQFDLSRIPKWEDFVRVMNYAMMKQFCALERGGRMAVLVGDIKKKGQLYSMLFELIKPGTLENVIIKAQHNCFSNQTQYSGHFIPILHEYLLIIKKDASLVYPILMTEPVQKDIRDMNGATWRDVVAAVLETCQSPVSLAYIYEQVEPYTKARKNQWWKEKVRQTLQCSPQLFVNTGRGMWALNRSA